MTLITAGITCPFSKLSKYVFVCWPSLAQAAALVSQAWLMPSGSSSHDLFCLSLSYVLNSYEDLRILWTKYPNDSGLLWFTILIWSICALGWIVGWPAVIFSRISASSVSVIRPALWGPLGHIPVLRWPLSLWVWVQTLCLECRLGRELVAYPPLLMPC